MGDGSGGVLIGWIDEGRIHFKGIDREGEESRPEIIIEPSIEASKIQRFQMTEDRLGNVIFVWGESAKTSADTIIYAQKINKEGKLLWGKTGTPVSSPGPRMLQTILADREGKVFVIWFEQEYGLFGQVLNDGGVTLWPTSGIQVISVEGEAYQAEVGHIKVAADGSGGIILSWKGSRSHLLPSIYAQRINAEGKILWPEDGIQVCSSNEKNGLQDFPEIVSDSQGGAFISWVQTGENYLLVQRINSQGETLWPKEALAGPSAGFSNKMIGDDQGNALLVWIKGAAFCLGD